MEIFENLKLEETYTNALTLQFCYPSIILFLELLLLEIFVVFVYDYWNCFKVYKLVLVHAFV